jgi:Flp pilus assembly protein TadG
MSQQSLSLQNSVNHRESGERGQTLVLFLLMMVILFVFVGMGIDLGFAYITKAQLSKAVDSAALSGMRNIAKGQTTAGLIASNAFTANYGKSGRDVSPPSLSVVFTADNNSNTLLNVDATVSVNTYFIRVMPAIGLGNWSKLTVHSHAQATRSTLIMTLVLDRSTSMLQNGGSTALPPAVTNFIALFDDQTDHAAMASFSSWSSVDVGMTQPFITKIQDAALAISFNGYTCSDEGQTNGLAQDDTMTNVSSVVRVIVFFTDGMANTFNYVFPCGNTNIAYDINYYSQLFDPKNGTNVNAGQCTIPAKLASINPVTGAVTSNAVDVTNCTAMHDEAENRAEWIAYLARQAGYTIYCIGLGNPNAQGECGGAFPVVNPVFLKALANTSDSVNYNPNQPQGDFAIASDSSQLNDVFQTIAAKILLRLSQ